MSAAKLTKKHKQTKQSYEIRTYKERGTWWAYAVDSRGNQIGNAQFAHLKSSAIKYLKSELEGTQRKRRGRKE